MANKERSKLEKRKRDHGETGQGSMWCSLGRTRTGGVTVQKLAPGASPSSGGADRLAEALVARSLPIVCGLENPFRAPMLAMGVSGSLYV